ncbi:MAG: inorganic pyrophosphatase [Candidatus Abawacabacteria bacterium RBG_16_42_10]|uniref:inorganic diphosphatase n=1 Tax=Candidatus Abawacabacteria bacterium RBG_16_42_10 TaxID=1817814 RepID=A0A1F4XKD5_9BACT|nr:MAG: inorganic pyrophosphatase [Candidatus Abawacabacteria bacterium RBG_16_42_10]
MTRAIDFLQHTVNVTIDRPLGSKHPKFDWAYPVNYGFIPGTKSGDGEEIDAYILGISEPLQTFRGKCIAIIHRTNDNDDKLIVVPEGLAVSDEKIQQATLFQEQYFQSEILRS